MRTVLILARSCRSCCRKNVNFKIPVLAPIFLRQFTLSVPAVISKESSAPCGQWPMPMGEVRAPIEGGNDSGKYSAPVDWNILLTVDWCRGAGHLTPASVGFDPQLNSTRPPRHGSRSLRPPYALRRLPSEVKDKEKNRKQKNRECQKDKEIHPLHLCNQSPPPTTTPQYSYLLLASKIC